jgi:hypothetical protein
LIPCHFSEFGILQQLIEDNLALTPTAKVNHDHFERVHSHLE